MMAIQLHALEVGVDESFVGKGCEEAGTITGEVPTTPASPPVAIVGMHRSGTSMVAKLLQRTGLNLGDEADLMPPAAENPEGFYEYLEFVRLNDEVLNVA